MGNEKISTKYKILEILRNSESVVSGEELALQSGVSRVSIWKAVQSLQNVGYAISSSKTGYKLDKDIDDSLFPWEFGNDEEYFLHFNQVNSTMVEAHKIAESESSNSEIKIITSDEQTEGKGHGDHSWITTKGSLACTIINREPCLISQTQRITMAAQIALARSLSSLTDRKFYVRWPNDVWTKQGKVAGVLDEVLSFGGSTKWINIGVGVNLYKSPYLNSTDYVFSKGEVRSRKEILLSFVNEFKMQKEKAYKDSSELCDEWNNLCFDKNKTVRISDSKKDYIFKEINGYGWAKLVSEKGKEKLVVPPGKCSFIKQ